MKNMEKLCRLIEEELQKIAENGLTQGKLDIAYKLVDMYKDLKNTEYWDTKSEYYMAVLEEMQDGYSQDGGYSQNDGEYSQRRGQKRDGRGRYSRDGGYSGYDDGGDSYARRGEHYVRGHYSRADSGYSGAGGYSGDHYGRYMDSKQSYRSDKSSGCKQRLMETLEDYMEEFTGQMEEMLKDADCAEERDTIKRYLSKIKGIA